MDKITEEFLGVERKVYPADGTIDLSDHCRIDNRICIHGHTYLIYRDMAIFSKADVVVQLDLYIKIIWQNRSTS